MIGRIPILDVQPVVQCGRYPAKAVPGEQVLVTATVFREGHELLGAGVVLRDPRGGTRPPALMRERAPGSDSYGTEVAADSPGLWHFRVEAWGDPVARWDRDAGIKVPIGQDVDLMLTEGALLLRRAASSIRLPPGAVPAQVHAARAARVVLN
nr:DUF3416 domain-containing protein [Actinomycetota bacterium]